MAQLFLERIYSDKETSTSILLLEAIQQSALPLLIQFIQRSLSNGTVLLCATKFTSEKYKTLFRHHPRLVIMNAYEDPFGWRKSESTEKLVLNDLDRCSDVFVDQINRCSGKFTFVIDSLHNFLLGSPVVDVFRLLKNISSHISEPNTFLAVSPRDIFYPTQYNSTTTLPQLYHSLSYIFTTTITLHNSKVYLSPVYRQEDEMILESNSTNEGICVVEHKKKSGKILRETCLYRIDESQSLLSFQAIEESEGDSHVIEQLSVKDENDPTANLSFNLRLTDQQRKAKDNVVLPYLKAQESPNTEDGAILYEPDIDDDFDDEDPDADLDI
ncbi:Elongator complex protein 5 [Paraphysoderma sedebokerense]|nr:Elongator complex protein 5 [Paraphysoderma sedebokerense]